MRISQLLLAVSSWPLSPVSEPSYSSSDVAAPGLLTVTPIPCLSPSPATIEDLVSCFEAYTVPSQHYTRAAYLDAQPQDPQLTAWKLAVSRLLAVDGSCSPTLLPAALNNIYKISAYTETSGKVFCVLSEVSATGGYYTKGWGFFAVPALRAAVSRFIHISAPHPLYDEGTVRQAAAVFKRTGAKSLLISGRHKNAYASVSCTGLQYSATDAAYDDKEPFFAASVAIRTWQETNDGCSSRWCAYIQLHDKGCSCLCDTTFISAGLDVAEGLDWYTTSSIPATRIRNQLDTEFPTWKNYLPPRSDCSLTATRNVVGRLVNGVPETAVCTTTPTRSGVTGLFVSIEQDKEATDPANYVGFARAVNKAIWTTCAGRMVMDPSTLLCRNP